jgi:hypothetical protein
VKRGQRRPTHSVVFAILVTFTVTLTAFGVAAGLGGQITSGGPETGQGAYVVEHPLAYWTWRSTQLATIPGVVPARVSLVAGKPTVLPRGGRSYTINAGVAGQTSVFWTFQQTTTAPRSTELKITLVDGLTAPASTIVVYVETSARALGVAANFLFYWDAGTFAPASLVIETMTATVEACTGIGVCP